jgi:hypothetical protein
MLYLVAAFRVLVVLVMVSLIVMATNEGNNEN